MLDTRWTRFGLLFSPLVFLGACVPESRQGAYSACFREHEGYLKPDRPQGSPPDRFVLDVLSMCMMSKGYRLNADGKEICSSPRTLTSECFTAGGPATWLRSLLD